MIRIQRSPLYVAAVSHPGMAGRQNEDRFAVSAYRLDEKDPTRSVFAIVSDGIGGHRAGEIAAEMAVETISHMVAQSDARRPLDVLDRAIQVTSEAIAVKAKDDTQRLGMGTTCACAWVIGDKLFTASVGDSRIYLLRNGGLMQLTVDHTWVQEAVEKGILQPEDARGHPNVHVIRRYLGSNKTPQADVRMRLAKNESDTQSRSNQGLRLLPGDVLLLCSDGLTDLVHDEEIEPAVRGLDLQTAAKTLVELACSRNGQDNITVVMVLVPWEEIHVARKTRFWKWTVWGLVTLASVALLMTAVLLVILFYLLP